MNQTDFGKMDSAIDYETVRKRMDEYIAKSKDLLAKNTL